MWWITPYGLISTPGVAIRSTYPTLCFDEMDCSTALYCTDICLVCYCRCGGPLFYFHFRKLLYNNPLPPSKALVILFVLASIEFWEPSQLPPKLNYPYIELHIPADGRCFWSSLFLGTEASSAQLWSWAHRARTTTGFASGEDMALEKNLVWEWLQGLLPHMDPACRARVESFECAVHDDIVPCHTVVYSTASPCWFVVLQYCTCSTVQDFYCTKNCFKGSTVHLSQAKQMFRKKIFTVHTGL